MKRLTKKAWFGPRKLIGWGWSPSSWEGYVVSVIYILLLALAISSKKTGISLVLSAVFILIVLLTGDKPGWAKWNSGK